MELLETRVLDYDMMKKIIPPDFLDEYALEVEFCCGDCDTTGVNLFNHWSNTSLQHEIIFQRDSYDNCVKSEDIVSF